MGQVLRWWCVAVEDDMYGYCFQETKPLPFDWVDLFVLFPGEKRPRKMHVRVSKVVNNAN